MNDKLIREIQLIELDILKQVISLCDRHNIVCYAYGGTLLGAIRHHGFIPWDDDVDLMMLRSDYDKFCEIAKKELQYPYFLQTNETDSYYNLYIAKVQNLSTTFVEIDKSPKQKMGIFIDVFPIDNSKRYTSFEKMVIALKNRTYKYCALDFYEPYQNIGYKIKGIIGKIINYCIYNNKPSSYFHKKRSCLYTVMSGQIADVLVERHTPIFYDKAIFDGDILVDFEDIKLRCPARYDELLKMWYGDYMKLPPENQRMPHHAVFVDTQKPYTYYLDNELVKHI